MSQDTQKCRRCKKNMVPILKGNERICPLCGTNVDPTCEYFLIGVVVLFIILAIVAKLLPEQKRDTINKPEPSVQTSTIMRDYESASGITVRGRRISIGDSADYAFDVIQPRDCSSDSGKDPNNAASLSVVKLCNIDNQEFFITFRREEDPGPYVVHSIEVKKTTGTPIETKKESPIVDSGQPDREEQPVNRDSSSYKLGFEKGQVLATDVLTDRLAVVQGKCNQFMKEATSQGDEYIQGCIEGYILKSNISLK